MLRIITLMILPLFFSFLYALEIGDVVSNTARLNYTYHGATVKEVKSNSVEHTIEFSEANITFLYSTQSGKPTDVLGTSAYQDANGVWHESKVPEVSHDTLSNLEDTTFYRQEDTVIISVVDADQNVDRDVRDIVEVTVTSDSGDVETLRLIETSKDSGIFVGNIVLTNERGSSYDNKLFGKLNENIATTYNDNLKVIKADSAIIVEKVDFNVWIEKQVNKTEASVGELLQYTLLVHNDEDFNIRNFLITDALPLGLKYEKGTATYENKKVEAKLSDDGRKIRFDIDTMEAKSQVEVKFIASVTAGVHNEKVTNNAWVTKSTVFKSNVATVTTHINEELMRSNGIILGQVSKEQNSSFGVGGVKLYLENGMYVVTDEHGKYHFSGVEAGRHIVQVDKSLLPKGYKMGSCEENARTAGNNFSKFVNVGKGALKRVDFCLKGEAKVVEKQIESDNDTPTKVAKMPEYTSRDLKSNASRAILWPPKEYVPFIPSMKMAIKHPKDERVDIWLNGQRVSKLNYDGNIAYKTYKNVIDLYRGVDLLERGNLIKVEYYNQDNKRVKTLTRKVYVSSAPVQVRYVKENSKTIADGKTSPVIAVKFLDDAGKPLRSGITGSFTIEAPYVSQGVIDQLKKNPLSTTPAQSRYTIHSDGIAYIKLQPTTQSGEVTLHFKLQEKDEVVRAWLKPALREWIMVGFAEGTVGYNTLSGHEESLSELGAKDKTITEGRISFFAKGKVKGDWLLSMAYDTGKDTSKSQFFDEIDPNAYYTLYNDNSQQNQEAGSRKKLYVKLEKEQFNILFGDYSTDLSYTELSAYSRRFTGLKSEYHGENLEAKVFASHTEQLFIKDEIRGDGTSGYYYLKSKEMIHFSEKITIEVRNRYREEEVLSKRTLQRFKDYDIDYALGRLYFKEPIYSNDEKFNPRFIVVDYEVNGDGGEHYTYGGRGAVKAFDGKVEVGGTYISEDSGKKVSKLMGADTTVHIGNSTRVKAEYAKTKTTEDSVSSQGEAKLAEIEHVSNGLFARAYYREQESAFGLGQLSSSLGATRKIGVDLSKQFENRQSHKLSLYRDSDLLNKVDSDVADFRMDWNHLNWDVFAGYRYAKVSTEEEMSQQLLFGGSYGFFDQRLKLSATREQTISDKESTLFPTKTTVGLNYALNSSIDFFSAYEWADNMEQGRAGVKVHPWSGMTIENTTLSEFSNDSRTLYNTLGGVQSFQVNDKLSLNVGYEKGKMLKETAQSNTSLSDKSFSAYRLGANYNGDTYSATINSEVRKAKDEDKVNLSTALYTQATDVLALALSGSLHRSQNDDHKDSDDNLRFSLAYRPEDDETIILDKLDFIHAKQKSADSELLTEKMVNNLNVNLCPTAKSEVSLQHGFKYVVDTVDDFEHTGVTQLFGVDARYDLTPTWELGMQGSLLYAQSANNMDYGFGLYSGHNLFDNMLLTLGYNWEGFEDRDFSLQTYRVEGPYFRFNMKFDQDSLKDVVKGMSW